jgi:hypothetical protein
VLLTAGGTSRKALGWFAEGVWCERSTAESTTDFDRRLHEIFINADRRHAHPRVTAAEDVFTTLLHEACHAWARANDIQDISRQGRYHNKRFAEIARKIGLVAEPDSRIGHTTPCPSMWACAEYADLLAELEAGLVLAREPEWAKRQAGTDKANQPQSENDSDSVATSSQYISASCRCQVAGRPVTVRIAKGYWPRTISCHDCQNPFTQS